jgi:hypothetical protein
MRRISLIALLVAAAAATGAPTQLTIPRAEGGISIDGVIDDRGWNTALKLETFVEYRRSENAPAPVGTAAWMAYDDAALYVAYRGADPQPHSIRAPFVDRDKVLADQDYFAVTLDTRNDRRSALVFRVNPHGVQADSVFNDATGEEDFAPDFFFEAKAHILPDGWAAELRIPFSSLRYADSATQVWAIMLTRNYPRDFRYVIANTPVPKGSNCFLCHASTLDGLRDLPRGGNVVAAPYSAAESTQRRVDERLAREPLRSDTGLDLKWNASTRLTIDATLNPDFSQIESDVPQLEINNRYALSFPEKRAFFLEGVDLLSTPVRAVYTRSITSPAWGLRATGEAGASAYTVLVAEDRGGGAVVLPSTEGSSFAPQDFRSRVLIGRVRTTFGRSFGGLLLSAREVEEGGHNRLFGPDFLVNLNGKDKLRGQLLWSTTENPNRPDLSTSFDGRKSSGHAARFVYTRDTNRYDIWLNHFDYGNGFRADNGFVPMVGARGMYLEIGSHHYPKQFASYVRPFVGGGHETVWQGAMVGVYLQGKWGLDGWVAWHPRDSELVRGDRLPYSFFEIHMKASPWGWIPAIQLDGSIGDRIDYVHARVGRGATYGLTTALRPTEHLELELNTNREWLDLADRGRLYSAQVNRVKATYVFNARSLVRVIGQHGDTHRARTLYASDVDDREGDLSFSALYGYRLNWQTTFYLGYGDARTLDERDRLICGSRSLFMKVSYAIRR